LYQRKVVFFSATGALALGADQGCMRGFERLFLERVCLNGKVDVLLLESCSWEGMMAPAMA
jgi:hypothetical protein